MVYVKKRPDRKSDCHPEEKHWAKGLCHTCYNKQYLKHNPRPLGSQRPSRLKHLYGLLPGDYEDMYDKQEGNCYTCGEYRDKLWVDHDHKTGKVRHLLCHRCNFVLGYYEKTPELFDKFKEYLLE